MKKYIIFDLDGTLISSHNNVKYIILEFFKEKQAEYYQKVRYALDFNKISNIQDLLKIVYGDTYDISKIQKDLYAYLGEKNTDNDFIEGTIEKLLELKDKYTFYLSTGISTKNAEQILDKGGVKQYFKLIQGSDIIPKSEEHLDIFKGDSGDEDFFESSISIGDSPKDEEFAQKRNIDFIKIGNKNKSIYNIEDI